MRKLLLAAFAAVVLAMPAMAAMETMDLPPGDEAAIQKAMTTFVKDHTVQGHYTMYDALGAGFVPLTFKQIHPGVRMIGGFYVSCLDFVDADGTLYDIDLMVAKADKGFVVQQDVVHGVGGNVRPYHNER